MTLALASGKLWNAVRPTRITRSTFMSLKRGLRSTPLRRSTLTYPRMMAHTTADWKSKAPRPPSGTSTFAMQESLPRLPVPDLDATLVKLDKTLVPLARNTQELETTRGKIQAFSQQGGLGRTLYSRLCARASDQNIVNWLEEFWDEVRWHIGRNPRRD